jgi:hypothetical protein
LEGWFFHPIASQPDLRIKSLSLMKMIFGFAIRKTRLELHTYMEMQKPELGRTRTELFFSFTIISYRRILNNRMDKTVFNNAA